MERTLFADLARPAQLVELVAWPSCALLALLCALSTLAADFPARDRALAGEGIALLVALALSAWAARRFHKNDPGLLGPTARLVLGLPLFLFGLIASAAGFAA